MRKLMCLMLLLSGLSVGCSDDDKGAPAASDDGSDNDDTTEETDPATGNPSDSDGTDDTDGTDETGGTDDTDGNDPGIPDDPSTGGGEADPNKYPQCPKDMIPAEFDPYTGEKPFSQEDLATCRETCAGQPPQECLNDENCPGFEAFNECISAGIIGCSAKKGGKCRVAYENFICCASASGCAEDDPMCLNEACGADLALAQTCVFQDDTVCNSDEMVEMQFASCFGDDAVGGETDAGTPGGDVDAGPGSGDEAVGGGVSNGDGANFSRAISISASALLRQISAR